MDTATGFPTLFLSHGSTMLAIEDSGAGRFLDGLGDALPKARTIHRSHEMGSLALDAFAFE